MNALNKREHHCLHNTVICTKTTRPSSQRPFVVGHVLCVVGLVWFSGCSTDNKPHTIITMEEPQGVRLSIREYGIYRIKGEERTLANSRIPPSTRTEQISFDSITDEIPGVLNTRFGFTYQIDGLPPFGHTNVTCVITPPEVRSPETKTTSTTKWTTLKAADESGTIRGLIGYAFERPYEIIPGPWVMHLHLDNKLQLRKTFRVSVVQTSNTNREDNLRGAKFYQKMAEQGHAEAQFRLATAYEEAAVLTNEISTLAARWYWAAATNNHAKAIERLKVGIPIHGSKESQFIFERGERIHAEATFERGTARWIDGTMRLRAAFSGSVLASESPSSRKAVLVAGMTKEEVEKTIQAKGLRLDKNSVDEWRIGEKKLIFKDDRLVEIEYPLRAL